MECTAQTAGICGLFCGNCPMYPQACHGCLSDKIAPHCVRCPSGIRLCASEHKVTRCFECAEFPCARLEQFKDSHWENGISHHAEIINNLQRMAEAGVDTWVGEQVQKSRCPRCGRMVPWYEKSCGC